MNWESFLIGALGGAVSGIVVPLLHDQLAWRVEKRRWARELLHDSLARIANLADDADCEFTGQFALAGQSNAQGVSESIALVRRLHRDKHKLVLYLAKSDGNALTTFLEAAVKVLGEANETWGLWHREEEDVASQAHHANTLHALSAAVSQSLEVLRPPDSPATRIIRTCRNAISRDKAGDPSNKKQS